MVGYILFVLAFLFSIMKFYRNRALFKRLSKKEWLQYIVGFLFAWIVSATIIIGGSQLTNSIQIGWLENILAILIILLGLASAGFIMSNTLPKKIKEFYM